MNRSSAIKAILLALIVLAQASFSQESRKYTVAPSENIKFDEFLEVSEAEWKRRLDRFASIVATYPEARLLAIVYTKIGDSRRSTDGLRRQYKEYFDNLKPDSFLFTGTGGYRKQQATELWVIGADKSFPKSTPDVPFKRELFREIGQVTDDEFIEVLKAFLTKQDDDAESEGIIINYGNDEEIAQRERLVTNNLGSRTHDRSRLTIVRGGLKGETRTSFWLVPPTAENPEP